jgi:hypothetical protein
MLLTRPSRCCCRRGIHHRRLPHLHWRNSQWGNRCKAAHHLLKTFPLRTRLEGEAKLDKAFRKHKIMKAGNKWGGQVLLQLSAEVDAGASVVEPAGQGSHEVERGAAENDPLGHSAQGARPSGEKLPCGQIAARNEHAPMKSSTPAAAG